MAPTAPPLSTLCRLVLLFRLVAVNVTIFAVLGALDRTPKVLAGLTVAALLSYLPLRMWDRLAPLLAAQPVLLAIDLGVTLSLYAFLGPSSPFFLYTLGTALLAGILYGPAGAVVFSVSLLGGYYGLVAAGGQVPGSLQDVKADQVQAFVTLPVLYPVLAAGGAAIRRLLDRQQATEAELRGAQLAAVAGEERSRVAREMHDSLGKTLYGIALSARALSSRVDREAPDSARMARDLSGAAQLAAEEARGLISDLRSDTLTLPLGAALADYVGRWSEESGVRARVLGESVDLPNPSTRYELFCIVKEALRNVERHARADSVAVTLTQDGDRVELSVADDGVGIGGSGDPRRLEPEGHYGLVGMAERAERVGATVTMGAAPGGGTKVVVRVRAGDLRTPEPWSLTEAHR